MTQVSLSPFPYPKELHSSTINSKHRPSSLSRELRQVKYFEQKILSSKKNEFI